MSLICSTATLYHHTNIIYTQAEKGKWEHSSAVGKRGETRADQLFNSCMISDFTWVSCVTAPEHCQSLRKTLDKCSQHSNLDHRWKLALAKLRHMRNLVLESISETYTDHRTLSVIYSKWHVYLHTSAKLYVDYCMLALISFIILLRQYPSVALELNDRAGYTSVVNSPWVF